MNDELPLVGVMLEQGVPPLLALKPASLGVCRLAWVVGWSEQPADYNPKVLARLGQVVDIAGLNQGQAAEALARAGVAGLLLFTETAQVLAATLSEALGFAFNSVDSAVKLSSKVAQRRALAQAGLPSPAFSSVRADRPRSDGHQSEGRPAWADFAYPAVLKPNVGSGSRDTFMVRSAEEVQEHLAAMPGREFALEEYIEDCPVPASRTGADVVSVESVAQDGRVTHLAVTGRAAFAPPFRETGLFMPADLSPEDGEAARELATKAAQALGATWGFLHTEVKFSPTGPQVIEVNGRMGGRIASLVSRCGGPDLEPWAMRLALGDSSCLPSFKPEAVAYHCFVVAPMEATQVQSIEGTEGLLALDGVEELSVNRKAGEKVSYREGGPMGGTLLYAGKVPDHAALRRLWDEADLILAGTVKYL